MSEQTLQEKLRFIVAKYETPVRQGDAMIASADRIDELERQLAKSEVLNLAINSQLMSAIDEKSQLVSQLAEAKKDQERLEWIMNNSVYVAYSMDGEVCHVRITADRGEDEYPAEGYPLKVYDDRRQAIDSAMKVKP